MSTSLRHIKHTAKPDFAVRLKEAADCVGGVRALAEKAGIHERSIWNWLSGTEMKQSALVTVAEVSGVSLSWLMTGEEPKMEADRRARLATEGLDEARRRLFGKRAEEQAPEFEYIPLYNVVAAAGDGSENGEEEIVEELPVPKIWLRSPGGSGSNVAAIVARGDSMEPELHDGDILLLDRADTELRRDGLYVLRYGDALRVKFLQRRADGGVLVQARAEGVADEIIPKARLGDLAIVGRVRWHGRTL